MYSFWKKSRRLTHQIWCSGSVIHESGRTVQDCNHALGPGNGGKHTGTVN